MSCATEVDLMPDGNRLGFLNFELHLLCKDRALNLALAKPWIAKHMRCNQINLINKGKIVILLFAFFILFNTSYILTFDHMIKML